MSEEDLARMLDELRARASEDGLQPAGVDFLIDTLHADQHVSRHLHARSDDESVTAVLDNSGHR